MAVETILREGGSMTRVDLTKAQCAELANYLRGVLNNGMGAGSFDKIEMLVLARRALAAAEELPEVPRTVARGPAARKPQPEGALAAGSPASEAAQLKRDTLERLTAYRKKDWSEQSGAAGSGLRKGGREGDQCGASGSDAEPGALPGGDLAGGGRRVGQGGAEERSGCRW
mgnify:CR=1 FL=1